MLVELKTGEQLEIMDCGRDIEFPLQELKWRGEGTAPRAWTRQGNYLTSRPCSLDIQKVIQP